MDLLSPRRGVTPQLVGEAGPALLEGAQSHAHLAELGVRLHQHAVGRLDGGVDLHGGGRELHGLAHEAEIVGGLRSVAERLHVDALEHAPFGHGPRAVVVVRVEVPAVEDEGGAGARQGLGPSIQTGGDLRPVGLGLELGHVHPGVLQEERVPLPDDARAPQGGPDLAGRGAKAVAGPGRRGLGPELLDETGNAYRLAVGQRQQSQQVASLARLPLSRFDDTLVGSVDDEIPEQMNTYEFLVRHVASPEAQ